jgi:hypothetical protein
MPDDAPSRVAVRSYRDVIDVVERRVFHVDRWRVPHPGGVPAAALGYFAAVVAIVAFVGRLPLVGGILETAQPALRFVGIPVICAWALSTWQVDGRRPHHALLSAVRHRLSARTLSGLRRTPPAGSRLALCDGATIAPCGDEPRYRAGRVRGPATVVLRYPAEVTVERRGRGGAPSPSEALARAKRLRVRARESAGRALVEGHAISVPAGSEVRFE